MVLPYVVLEWIAFLLFTAFSSSNFGPETGFPDRYFVVFSFRPSECRDNIRVLQIRPRPLPAACFQIYYQSSSRSHWPCGLSRVLSSLGSWVGIPLGPEVRVYVRTFLCFRWVDPPSKEFLQLSMLMFSEVN
jgi:hypothetical protein